jgi:hypothetical protein
VKEEREPAAPSPANPVGEFVARLQEATQNLMSTASSGIWAAGSPQQTNAGELRLPSPPGALSAQQLEMMTTQVAARREQVRALSLALSEFDEQLARLEQMLGPLLEWSRTWADLERDLHDLWNFRPGGSRERP